MGRFERVGERARPQAFRDLERLLELHSILDPEIGCDGAGEQPAGEPVVVFGPGGERLGPAGRSRLAVAHRLDGVERGERVRERLAARREEAHLLPPGERQRPGVLRLLGDGERAVDRPLRGGGIERRQEAGLAVEAVALVARRHRVRQAGREVSPGLLALRQRAQDQMDARQQGDVFRYFSRRERLAGQAGGLPPSLGARQLAGLVEHRAGHAVAGVGLGKTVLPRHRQPGQGAEGIEPFLIAPELELEVPQGEQAFQLGGVGAVRNQRGFRLAKELVGHFQVFAGAPQIARPEHPAAGDQPCVAGGLGRRLRPVHLGFRRADASGVEQQPVEVDAGYHLAHRVLAGGEGGGNAGELVGRIRLPKDEIEAGPRAPRVFPQQLLEPGTGALGLVEGGTGPIEAVGGVLRFRLDGRHSLAALEAGR